MAHVRGAASPALSARIEAACAGDPALRAEIALMRGLGPALAGPGDDAGGDDLGWRRLETAIRRDAAQPRPAPGVRGAGLWRVAAAIFGVTALGQAIHRAGPGRDAPEARYEVVSQGAERPALGVAFAPEATAAEIGALLQALDARIVDGPGALGVYRLAFGSDDARRQGAARLRSSPLIAEE